MPGGVKNGNRQVQTPLFIGSILIEYPIKPSAELISIVNQFYLNIIVVLSSLVIVCFYDCYYFLSRSCVVDDGDLAEDID